MKGVVLLSGGMDSTALAYRQAALGDELHFLSFAYGQRHGSRELTMAQRTGQKLGASWSVVSLSALGTLLSGSALTDAAVDVPEGHYTEESMRATVVPNRNAIMLSIAVGIAVARQADYVAAAVHAGDHAVYPDCRPEFVDAFDGMAKLATAGFAVEGFKVIAPFVHWTKAGIAAEGQRLNVPWEDTWSCYVGGDIHCGRCGTCVERAEAFDLAGVPDPTVYEDPNFWREQVAIA